MLEQRVHEDLLEQLGLQERLGPKVTLVMQVLKVIRVQLVPLEQEALLELRVIPEQLVERDLKVQKVMQVLQELMEQMVLKEIQVQEVLPDLPVQMDQLDPKDQQETKGQQEAQDHKVHRVQQVQEDPLVLLDQQDHRGLPEQMVIRLR